MEPRFETLAPVKLAGMRLSMCFAAVKTPELWRRFMPLRPQITSAVGTDLYSVEVYEPDFFENYSPNRFFEKWAAVEVSNPTGLPQGMESLLLPGGLYAVFLHKGPASRAGETYNYIFLNWLPKSGYRLDQRPHFALMGSKYIREHPDSEEDIYVPVQKI